VKIGDLVRVREEAGFGRSSWDDFLLVGPMLVVRIVATVEGSDGIDIDISDTPVVEVLTEEGLWRVNGLDVEIVNESR
jgi:hypothetical protein